MAYKKEIKCISPVLEEEDCEKIRKFIETILSAEKDLDSLTKGRMSACLFVQTKNFVESLKIRID